MGILDDAIREHLELKRQHGAENDDLERLENEAFGPATRPGDPEFAEQPSETGESDSVAVQEPEAVEPPADGSEGSSDEPDIPGWLGAGEDETRIIPPPATPAEEARIDHPELGQTADHPAPVVPEEEEPFAAEPEPIAEAPVTSIPTEEPGPEVAEPEVPEAELAEPESGEPPESPERAIFAADDIDFGDLDLDLDEEEAAGDAPLPTEPAAEPPLPDTPFEEDDETADELGENDSSLAPGPGAVSPPAEGEGDEEDLLEETPDFLQDAPEGERLWFEQGAPKDFDFDDN